VTDRQAEAATSDTEQPAHPTSGLNDTVHQRHRLGILTIAAEADRVEFSYLRDTLGLTGGNLSRHLAVLEEANLISLAKGYQGQRPRTWITISDRGRDALAAELNALRQLVERHRPPTGTG
jgi:DNA-binding MarR family transcriptional regulator